MFLQKYHKLGGKKNTTYNLKCSRSRTGWKVSRSSFSISSLYPHNFIASLHFAYIKITFGMMLCLKKEMKSTCISRTSSFFNLSLHLNGAVLESLKVLETPPILALVWVSRNSTTCLWKLNPKKLKISLVLLYGSMEKSSYRNILENVQSSFLSPDTLVDGLTCICLGTVWTMSEMPHNQTAGPDRAWRGPRSPCYRDTSLGVSCSPWCPGDLSPAAGPEHWAPPPGAASDSVVTGQSW